MLRNPTFWGRFPLHKLSKDIGQIWPKLKSVEFLTRPWEVPRINCCTGPDFRSIELVATDSFFRFDFILANPCYKVSEISDFTVFGTVCKGILTICSRRPPLFAAILSNFYLGRQRSPDKPVSQAWTLGVYWVFCRIDFVLGPPVSKTILWRSGPRKSVEFGRNPFISLV